MRAVLGFALLLTLSPVAVAQIKEERRLDVRLNTEIYPQGKAKDALQSLLRALDKERYDYIIAHLLEPAYINDQLRITAPYYEKLAAARVASEDLLRKGFDPDFIRARQRDLAFQSNLANLIYRVRTKL